MVKYFCNKCNTENTFKRDLLRVNGGRVSMEYTQMLCVVPPQELQDLDYGDFLDVFCTLENEDYCEKCVIENVKSMTHDHLRPYTVQESWTRLVLCQCDQHHTLRNDGTTLFTVGRQR